MTQWLLAGVVATVAIVSVKRYPSFHPSQLWAIPWALATFAYALKLLPYRDIRFSSAALMMMSVVAFVLGTELARRRRTGLEGGLPLGSLALRGELKLERAAMLAFVIAALWCAVFLAQAAGQFGLGNVLSADFVVREAIGAGEFGLTIKYTYAALGSAALAAVVAGRSEPGRSRRLWLLISALSIALIFFATGRATLMAGAISALVAFCLSAGVEVTRRRLAVGSLVVAVAAVAVFLAGSELSGKTFANNPELAILPSSFNDHNDLPDWSALPYQYISAPIAAADVQLSYTSGIGGSWGCATLPEACSVLQSLGFGTAPIDRVRPFTAHPLIWNTYTSIDSPALDFGWVLTAPFFFVIGVLSGALWNRSRSRGPGSVVVYALLAPALLTGFNVFNFTAPHVIGSMVYAAALMWVATAIPGQNRGNPGASDVN